MMDLFQLGWSDFHKAYYEKLTGEGRDTGCRRPGRISEVRSASCLALTESGEETAFYQGRLRKPAPGEATQAAVGDWAVLETEESGATAISRILPRKSSISRNKAGAETSEQVMAANVDTAFIVSSLNSELNPNRIERFLVAVYDGGVSPVVLLNKSDICPEPGAKQAGIEARLPGVPVHAISAATGGGMGELNRYLGKGRTAVFLGSSGVGKSTIINRLLGGDTIKTAEVSGYKDRGRHTTTSREIHLLDSGGIVIDTPGLRELQIWEGGEGISQTFPDIEELAGRCRFGDCRHMEEPGCAVRAALEDGTVSPERFRSYQKILREAMFHRRRQDQRLRIEETRRWKAISKSMRHYDKSRRFSG